MKKILILSIVMILLLCGCSNNKNNDNSENNKVNEVNNVSGERVDSMKLTIDGKEYIVKLEDNDTVKTLISLLPMELDMSDLNNNEKYYYLDNNLPTSSYNPGHINKGDVMLYGNNCLVIFYKSFDTNYKYTKIGHIDNLDELGNKDVLVKINK